MKNEVWPKIVGNEHVKRGVEVALAGGHTVAIVGHPDNGMKHFLEILGDKLLCLSPCKCGNFKDSSRVCSCTPGAIHKHRAKKDWIKSQTVDIMLELITPHPRDYSRKSEPFEEVEKRIKGMGKTAENKLDDSGQRLLEMACGKLGMTAGQVERARLVACTIAKLDNSKTVEARHIAEAIQYRGGVL